MRLNLEADKISSVTIISSRKADTVKCTTVGAELLGRIVDALGNFNATERRASLKAPGILPRRSSNRKELAVAAVAYALDESG